MADLEKFDRNLVNVGIGRRRNVVSYIWHINAKRDAVRCADSQGNRGKREVRHYGGDLRTK